MGRTPKQYCCLAGVALWVSVSLLVVFMPQLFYTDVMELPVSQRNGRQNALVSLRKKYNKNGFDRDLNVLQQDIAKSKAEIKNLNKQAPMWGKPKPQLQNAISMANRRIEELYHTSKALQLERDTALTQIRALTPVFSKMAFDETRELFKKRQEEYAGIFCWFWKWDMMWSMLWMPMGGRDGGIGEQIARVVLDLMYKLTMGTIFALGDFAVRLPFWLKEYQIFTYDEIAEDLEDADISSDNDISVEDEDEDDVYERMRRKHSGDDLEDEMEFDEEEHSVQKTTRRSRGKKYDDFETVSVVGSSGGWMATLSGFMFWCMSMCAASGATLGIILLIWSPIIALVIYAAINKHQMGRRGETSYQGYRQYHQHYE